MNVQKLEEDKMNNKIESYEKSQVKITMELTKEEWTQEVLNAYNKTKGKYSAPGFRKGKVPMGVLISQYGEGLFYEDAINLAFNKYYSEVLEANKDLDIIGPCDIDVENLSEDGLTLVAIAPVKPEFEIGKYKGMNIEKVEYNVEDADIDAEIEKKRENAGRLVDCEGRSAETGDTCNIDFSGSVDGVKFDGGTAAGHDLVLGSHSFIPGFEEGVVGMNIGETKVVTVKFPEEYQEATLAGKDADFEVVLNSLKSKELPAIDAEFVKDVSEFNTIEELREDIRKTLKESNDKKASYETENKILQTICENTTIEIPDAMITNQVENMVKDFEYRLMYQGLNLETYMKYMNTTVEEFSLGFKPEAEKAVKSQLVIDKIIQVEKFEVTDAEVDVEIGKLAESAKKTVEEYKTGLQAQNLEYIKKNALIDKLLVFLKNENIK